jgi:hypothetical protein
MADKVHISRGDPGPASCGRPAGKATSVRSDRGDGADRRQHYQRRYFHLSTSLAAYGPITLISMPLTTVGALALAPLSAALSRRLPTDDRLFTSMRIAFSNRVVSRTLGRTGPTAWPSDNA